MVCISMLFNLRRFITMNNNKSKETNPLAKNSNQEEVNAIAKAMIVSFAWSLTDLLAENKPKDRQELGNSK